MKILAKIADTLVIAMRLKNILRITNVLSVRQKHHREDHVRFATAK